jgi:hypothetical protein
MKAKKLISTLLAVTLILSTCIVPAFASSEPSFNDVPITHWAYDSISALSEQNIIGGKGNGMFDPQGSVTSAEFLKMLLCVTSGTMDFSAYDYFAGHWWSPYLGAALEYGIITSREAFNEDVIRLSDAIDVFGGFAPRVMDSPASRREMAKYTMRAMKVFDLVSQEVDITGISGVMPDYNLVSDDVRKAYALGIITGQAGGYFNGNKTATKSNSLPALLAPKETLSTASPSSNIYGMEFSIPSVCTITFICPAMSFMLNADCNAVSPILLISISFATCEGVMFLTFLSNRSISFVSFSPELKLSIISKAS